MFGQKETVAPVQPIPYSHKQHIALGLVCKNCHENADPGEAMGIPAVAKCMACHRTVAKDKPSIEQLAGFAERNAPVPWVRVYQIPSYVFFSHRAHLESGATCGNCHGPVEERDVLRRETDISMGGCMSCHKEKKAPNDCNFCHEPK